MTAPQQTDHRLPADPAASFHWFQGASVRALYDRLGAADPDTARLEVRTDGDHMMFRVVSTGAPVGMADATATDINDSRVCPPICPQ